MTLDHEIAAARLDLAHRGAGPITAFALITRATEYATKGLYSAQALAIALHDELEERGYLADGEDEIPGS